MKKVSLKFKCIGLILVLALTFQSLHSINSHSYTAGFDNFHHVNTGVFTCFFAGTQPTHSSYLCGQSFHLN